MRVVVVTPPEPLLTADDAKAALGIDGSDRDELLDGFIAAATAHIDGPDGWLGRALGEQELEAHCALLTGWPIYLPYPPVVSVVSIVYDDRSGVERSLTPSAYELRGNLLSAAWGTCWPVTRASVEPVRVRYRAGYTSLPAPIRQAILLMVGDLWHFRQTATPGVTSAVPMSVTAERLLTPFRVYA